MGSAKNSSAARKARIEEMRRTERARERRNRALTIAASVVVVAGLVVGGVVLVKSQSGDKKNSASDSKSSSGDSGHWTTGKDGVQAWSGKLARTHVTAKVSYPMHPPVGGNHSQYWASCTGMATSAKN